MRTATQVCFRFGLVLGLASCCAHASPPPRTQGYEHVALYDQYGNLVLPARAPARPDFPIYREPAPGTQSAPYNQSPYYGQSPWAASPLYRADNPGTALASPCEDGCNGHRCDVNTGRCIFPCRTNADCETGYSCERVGPRSAAICVWP